MYVKPPLPTHTRQAAVRLRQTSTDAERALWFHLRGGRLQGYKFRRQHPIPPYVVDFYCAQLKLIVELDGSRHAVSTDAARTSALQRQGLAILRFWDDEVLRDTRSVLAAIANAARARTLTRPFGAPVARLARPALARQPRPRHRASGVRAGANCHRQFANAASHPGGRGEKQRVPSSSDDRS